MKIGKEKDKDGKYKKDKKFVYYEIEHEKPFKTGIAQSCNDDYWEATLSQKQYCEKKCLFVQ